MNKRLQLLIIVFGFLLVPMYNYACNSKVEKSCCEKQLAAKSEQKKCCDSKKASDQESNSCGGKCGHSNCTSASSVNLSLISYFDIEFKNTNIAFYAKKSNFYYIKTFISSGFTSVWLPPNIK